MDTDIKLPFPHEFYKSYTMTKAKKYIIPCDTQGNGILKVGGKRT